MHSIINPHNTNPNVINTNSSSCGKKQNKSSLKDALKTSFSSFDSKAREILNATGVKAVTDIPFDPSSKYVISYKKRMFKNQCQQTQRYAANLMRVIHHNSSLGSETETAAAALLSL